MLDTAHKEDEATKFSELSRAYLIPRRSPQVLHRQGFDGKSWSWAATVTCSVDGTVDFLFRWVRWKQIGGNIGASIVSTSHVYRVSDNENVRAISGLDITII
jgi:hypothetical protein